MKRKYNNILQTEEMTLIIHFKDKPRKTYSNRYNEDIEHERNAAWEDVHTTFPDADYIEEF